MDACNYRTLCHSEIISILENKIICNLGFSYDNKVSIIPMQYIFEEDDKNIIFFFIFMNSKINLNNLKSNENVCIELDDYISNFYKDAYQSVIAKGAAEIITNLVQQNYVLNKFIKRYHKSLKDYGCRNDLKYIKVPISSIEAREYNYDF